MHAQATRGWRSLLRRAGVHTQARVRARAMFTDSRREFSVGSKTIRVNAPSDGGELEARGGGPRAAGPAALTARGDRKSTRLNSSHLVSSYAVFCLKKKNYKRKNKYNNKWPYRQE